VVAVRKAPPFIMQHRPGAVRAAAATAEWPSDRENTRNEQ